MQDAADGRGMHVRQRWREKKWAFLWDVFFFTISLEMSVSLFLFLFLLNFFTFVGFVCLLVMEHYQWLKQHLLNNNKNNTDIYEYVVNCK